MPLLKFGKGNAKLDSFKEKIITFSLPAGRSCPGANECKSMAVRKNGKTRIKDGPNTKFRCFAASQEVMYPATYNARHHNFKALRGQTSASAALLILTSLPKKAKYVRVHVSGDFFSQAYFNAWMLVAKWLPDVTFYAYTKSIHYWVNRFGKVPANFILTASYGGRYDALISEFDLRYAKVVFSEEEARTLRLEIDHDDSHAIKQGKSFALLIHGTQPKGSEAAKAKSKLKGKGSYSKKKLKVAKK
jgi:hypothetical protein